MAELPSDVVEDWLIKFETFLQMMDTPESPTLFADDARWRDIVAFSWDLHQKYGGEEVSSALLHYSAEENRDNFRLPEVGSVPVRSTRFGVEVIEAPIDRLIPPERGTRQHSRPVWETAAVRS